MLKFLYLTSYTASRKNWKGFKIKRNCQKKNDKTFAIFSIVARIKIHPVNKVCQYGLFTLHVF